MSLLTRIFVCALVVLSLLLSAATITFVSAIDDYKTAMNATNTKNQSLQAQLTEEKNNATLSAAAKDEAVAKANAMQAELSKSTADMQKQLVDAGAKLAEAQTRLAIAEANVSKEASALNALQASNTAYQAQIGDYRSNNDRLQTQNGELNVALTEQTNKFNITEEQRRILAEQLTEAKSTNDKISSALRDRGVDPNRVTTGGLAAGAPPINGVIRATSTISGIPHVAISVGSEDAVKVGMEFKVLDRSSGRFLGTLTVVAVEPNEAVGRLQGPDIAAIAAGAEVRTQL